jgi:hypothetical protein
MCKRIYSWVWEGRKGYNAKRAKKPGKEEKATMRSEQRTCMIRMHTLYLCHSGNKAQKVSAVSAISRFSHTIYCSKAGKYSICTSAYASGIVSLNCEKPCSKLLERTCHAPSETCTHHRKLPRYSPHPCIHAHRNRFQPQAYRVFSMAQTAS